TGRRRRVGWLDAVMLKHSAQLNTCSELAMTGLAVLAALDEVKVCVAYRGEDGTHYDHVPYHQSVLHKGTPLFETFPGWRADIGEARVIDDLPANAQSFVRFVESYTNVPLTFVSVGRGREQTVVLPRAA